MDKSTSHLELAAANYDYVTDDFAEALRTADIIIISTPVSVILTLLERVGSLAKPGALIMDLGSAKQAIVAAMDNLPPHVTAIGGHPMCGKETSGPQTAEGALFINRPFVLCPTARTTPEALELADALVTAIHAHRIILEAAQHDAAVAAISHMPYLLSIALVQHLNQEPDPGVKNAAWILASSGFRDTSRLAASDITMMYDTLMANRSAVEGEISAMIAILQEIRDNLYPNSVLRATLEQARQARLDWQKSHE